MARIMEPTDEQVAGWQKWLASRPEHVRAVAARFEPWSLYRLTSTGGRATIRSFGECEDGTVTVTVAITGEYNLTMFDREVFGIKPDDLEPCELPAEDEMLGAMMTHDEVQANLPALRAHAAANRTQ